MDLQNNKEVAAALLLADRVEAIMHALDARIGVVMPEPVALGVAVELGYANDNTGLADLAIHHGAIISRTAAGICLMPEEMES